MPTTSPFVTRSNKTSDRRQGAIRWWLVALVLGLSALSIVAPAIAGSDDGPDGGTSLPEELLEGVEYRMIGPYRGGRVTAVAGHVDTPYTFYMGSTGGGVWRTTNAGQTWENLTDDVLGVGSVGAVTVAPSDRNVIYVGTGSAGPRGNVSIGDGVYGSVDAGKTWKHLGLEESGSVAKIIVHPSDAYTAWAAVLGNVFGPNPERGVFVTRDGGATWEHTLFVSEGAGAVDLSIDPTNPRVLYAAIWRVERKPWTLIDGGEEGGLYKSVDGGVTWKQLGGGLPTGVLGRIGVSVSPKRPDRVWALITADEGRGGLFLSEDAGESWTRTSTNRDLQTRGWYYSHVDADPSDADTVWVSNVGFYRSQDTGTTFERIPTPHSDNHDLWINPERPELMVQSNDGGANVSVDGARSWSSLHNQPTAEFYRVSVDNDYPYRVYGAQQDNSTISVPSFSRGDITPEQEWYSVAGAESGHIAIDPEDSNIIYSGNYLGQIDRYDHRTGYSDNVILYPQMQDGTAPRDLEYRFQWNAPILISRHDKSIVYHASNYVHRTRDGGQTWETISPDLTRNDAEKQALPGGPVQFDHTGVEVYNTVFALAESPYSADELWAGADDGTISLSRDDGATWSDVTPSGMPVDATVNSIDVSEHAEGRAYVAAYRYRNDDWAPYVFRTDDWGASWKRIVDGLPDDHPVRVVREDPEREGLLFAGTEFGMFHSVDGGTSWSPLQLNLPHTPIADLVIHQGDLVVATQGRSFWILDDLELLRQLERDDPGKELGLWISGQPTLVSARGFRGPTAPESPDHGAVLYVWIGREEDGSQTSGGDGEEELVEDLELSIVAENGDVMRRFVTSPSDADLAADPVLAELPEMTSGMNRFVWSLRSYGPDLVDGAVMSLSYTGGPPVPPGSYRAELSRADDTTETTGTIESVTVSFEVRKDPRLTELTNQDLRSKWDFTLEVRERLTGIHDRIKTLRTVRDAASSYRGRAQKSLPEGEQRKALMELIDELSALTTEIEETLIQTKSEVNQDAINFPPKIDNQYAYLYSHAISNSSPPSEGTRRRLVDLDAELAELLQPYDGVLAKVDELNALLAESGLNLVTVGAPE